MNQTLRPSAARLGRIGSSMLGLIILIVTGCGDGSTRPPGVAVTGTVQLDGKPLKQGTVLFHPKLTTGMGDAISVGSASAPIQDGKFSISAPDGPPAGSAVVQVLVQNELSFQLDDEQAFAKAVEQGKTVTPYKGNVTFKDPGAAKIVIVENGPPLSFDLVSTKVATSSSPE